MREILKSRKMDDVCYEIRGPLLREAKRLEEEGYTIIKLNSGNPPAFGINSPDEIIRDAIRRGSFRRAKRLCSNASLRALKMCRLRTFMWATE